MNPRVGEWREMSREDLIEALDEHKEELFNLRFQKVIGQLDNTARIGEVKRDIARIATILREQEIAAARGTE
jgi:large subunit ribosomal protein L29